MQNQINSLSNDRQKFAQNNGVSQVLPTPQLIIPEPDQIQRVQQQHTQPKTRQNDAGQATRSSLSKNTLPVVTEQSNPELLPQKTTIPPQPQSETQDHRDSKSADKFNVFKSNHSRNSSTDSIKLINLSRSMSRSPSNPFFPKRSTQSLKRNDLDQQAKTRNQSEDVKAKLGLESSNDRQREEPTFLVQEAIASKKLLDSLDDQIQDIENMFT